MISLSQKAIDKVKELQNKHDKQGWPLRLGIKGGGCAGFNYALYFDKSHKESDQVFEEDGVKILVDPKSYLYLVGTKIDYIEELTASGFVFENPNSTGSCGCGHSFKA